MAWYIKSITLSPDSHLTLYADEMLLYRSISSSAGYMLFCRMTQIEYPCGFMQTIQKCKVMKVARKRTGICPPILHLCGQPLHGLLQISWDLLSSDLYWIPHIESLCSKVRKLTGLIYCCFYQHLSLRFYLRCMFHLSVLTSSMMSQVWNTHKTSEIKTIENVQKFALRMCAKQLSNGYEDLLQLFSQPFLQQHGLKHCMCLK